MGKTQSKGRARAARGVKAGKRGVKKGGLKLKDLDAKGGKQIRGSITVNCGAGMSKNFYEWIK